MPRKVPRCVELWASTSATEYQLNEAFQNVIKKHLNWDILKQFQWLFFDSAIPVHLVSSHKFIIYFVFSVELCGFHSRAAHGHLHSLEMNATFEH